MPLFWYLEIWRGSYTFFLEYLCTPWNNVSIFLGETNNQQNFLKVQVFWDVTLSASNSQTSVWLFEAEDKRIVNVKKALTSGYRRVIPQKTADFVQKVSNHSPVDIALKYQKTWMFSNTAVISSNLTLVSPCALSWCPQEDIEVTNSADGPITVGVCQQTHLRVLCLSRGHVQGKSRASDEAVTRGNKWAHGGWRRSLSSRDDGFCRPKN
jgi:hypothetical protein